MFYTCNKQCVVLDSKIRLTFLTSQVRIRLQLTVLCHYIHIHVVMKKIGENAIGESFCFKTYVGIYC